MASGIPGFAQDLADECSADVVGFGDFGEGQAALTIAQNSSPVDVEWTPADVSPFQLGSPHAGTDTFDD